MLEDLIHYYKLEPLEMLLGYYIADLELTSMGFRSSVGLRVFFY